MAEHTDAARILFDKLTAGYVTSELLGKEFEGTILECKTKTTSTTAGLDESDKSSFAKALSGFANTSGGVLLWGISAKVGADGIDQLQHTAPITGLRAFESKLREIESRIVEHPVPAVEYKRLETADDTGMLAVFIPQSPFLPHRVNRSTDHHFYLRVGGAFGPLSLSIVEELFSRRASPQLEIYSVPRTTSGNLRIARLGIRNVGKVTARSPYLVLQLPPKTGAPPVYRWSQQSRGFDNISPAKCVMLAQHQGESERIIAWQDGSQVVIHPGQELEIVELVYHAEHNEGKVKGFIRYWLYAEGMKAVAGTVEVTA